ncbi:MAG TPA: AAA family ATPase [Sporichthya sp.]|nr:AAA family ATPase [Sporichthya sp.]
MSVQPPRSGSVHASCPTFIGRDAELAHVLATLGRETPRTIVIRGEAGVGKTRLLREALAVARGRGVRVLLGRCVQQGQAPYRPLTEALLGAARAGVRHAGPELQPFRHALGALVPDWRESDVGDTSPLLVGEGLLRLARSLAGPAGALVAVEDLHWSDPDTTAALEYLADNLAGQPVTLILTTRGDEGAAVQTVLGQLAARGAAEVLDLGRLTPADATAMARACAGPLVAAVVDLIGERAEGLPLLIEELASFPAAGISSAVPAGFADAVIRRLASLPAEAVLCVQCAAVLGRRFDWRLLPTITGLDELVVHRALADAVGLALLAPDDDEFAFRHGMTREAVLAAILAPTRMALSRRAAQAVEASSPEDPLLAADLWSAAGDGETAAAGLVRAGRDGLARGSLTSAVRALERAALVPGIAPATRADALEALTEALALAARLDDALARGVEALDALRAIDAPTVRVAAVHLALARAAVSATHWDRAREQVAAARREAGSDRALLAATDALAAHVAMGELRPDDAVALARAALAAAEDLPDVACAAYEVIGRRERLRDLDRAEEAFTREHELAREHGLALWSIRALHELGTIDMLQRLSPDRLRSASEQAYRAGALALAATLDLQLVGLHGFLFQLDDGLAAGTRSVEVARTLGLTEVHGVALLQLGFIHALAGRPAAMEDVIGQATRVRGEDPETMSLAWGHARATASLMAEDRRRARDELEIAMTWARRTPNVTGGFSALSALLRVVEGAGVEAVDDVAGMSAQTIPLNAAVVEFARAVLQARTGDRTGAVSRVEAATTQLAALPGWLHLSRRLLAEAAIADGWGDPAAWMADAHAWFAARGHDAIAAACRDLVRSAGGTAPRTSSDVPAALQALGITGREIDVLRLLGQRLSNREIAERLVLSPRTVEKHVERLMQKTGGTSRTDLARLAHESLGPRT